MDTFTLRLSTSMFTAVLLLLGSVGTAIPAVTDKVLRIANLGEPETLDPHKTSTTIESKILLNLFEGLVVQDRKGEVAPGVAEAWSMSTDGVTYTFGLRPNAKWSNGDPVTASD